MLSTLANVIIYCASGVLACWVAGAIFYDVGKSSKWGAMVSLIWLMAVTAAFYFWQPAWKPFLLLVAVSYPIIWWWFTQQPSNNRNWDSHFARLPRLELVGDKITVDNVRNAEYQPMTEIPPRFESRQYRLSELRSLDVLVAYWGSRFMCHPMFIFDFGPDGRLCISIEVRYRVGQKYSLLRSLYRQQELMYVVCDERDAIHRRTKVLPAQDLYLYKLHSPPIAVRSFLFEYANSINSIAEFPRWYHGLTTNCTTSIYSQGRGRLHWDWRILFNGALDRMLYQNQLLDQSLSFEDLKKQSRVNEIANSAPDEDFGDYIRIRLPGYQGFAEPIHHAQQLSGGQSA